MRTSWLCESDAHDGKSQERFQAKGAQLDRYRSQVTAELIEDGRNGRNLSYFTVMVSNWYAVLFPEYFQSEDIHAIDDCEVLLMRELRNHDTTD